jgi:hypothetical protein
VINVHIIMFGNRAMDLINCQRPNEACWIAFLFIVIPFVF